MMSIVIMIEYGCGIGWDCGRVRFMWMGLGWCWLSEIGEIDWRNLIGRAVLGVDCGFWECCRCW